MTGFACSGVTLKAPVKDQTLARYSGDARENAGRNRDLVI